MRMPQISRARALAYALAVLLVLVLGGRFALGRDDPPASDPGRATPAGSAAPEALEATDPPARVLLVHVVGAVLQPGLYRLREGSRVDDAIRRAGGAKRKAALELVNLAAPVADGQQVLVPLRGRGLPALGTPPGSAPASGAPTQKVRLNSATLEELDTLPGVGPITAQKILDYRTEHGAFQTIEELDAVPGIGPARLAELTPLVDL
jgi:competence protein ComEA